MEYGARAAVVIILVGTSLSRHYVRSAFDLYLQGRGESIAALVYCGDHGIPGGSSSTTPTFPPCLASAQSFWCGIGISAIKGNLIEAAALRVRVHPTN